MIKNNKTIVRILVIAVVGVWGAIAVRIYESITSQSTPTDSDSITSTTVPTQVHERYVYIDDVRDPFHPTPPPVNKKTKTDSQKKKEAIIIPVPFTLSGVILGKPKATAVLLSTDGNTFFTHEGDTLKGVKILKITRQSVEYLFNKKKNEWHVE